MVVAVQRAEFDVARLAGGAAEGGEKAGEKGVGGLGTGVALRAEAAEYRGEEALWLGGCFVRCAEVGVGVAIPAGLWSVFLLEGSGCDVAAIGRRFQLVTSICAVVRVPVFRLG
jgi:hypothetical protein